MEIVKKIVRSIWPVFNLSWVTITWLSGLLPYIIVCLEPRHLKFIYNSRFNQKKSDRACSLDLWKYFQV